MNSQSGTYALVLYSAAETCAQIGRWGQLKIRPGYYIYVGSAFGPGGVLARVSRHCRIAKSKHWHIDYLREFANPVSVWYSHKPSRLEHRWAEALTTSRDAEPVRGFGCSDCTCESHLFFTDKAPELAKYTHLIGSSVQSWRCELHTEQSP